MPTPYDPATNNFGSTNTPTNRHSLHMRLDLRVLVALLLLVIIGMLIAWHPWKPGIQANGRTISVTGEATVRAEADNFVFYPSYEFTNNDRDAARKAMSTRSDELVAKLKALGVSDSNIKTDANGYGRGPAYPAIAPGEPDGGSKAQTYNLQLTVTTTSRDQAQKVQDYLASTSPSGSVTPTPAFSDKKRKELEGQARNDATKDARSKADQSARNLGFTVGAVKTVNDGNGFNGGVEPLTFESKDAAISSSAGSAGLGLQPGQNELHYSVSVVYYVK